MEMVITLDSVGTKAKSPNAARIGQRHFFIKSTFYNAQLYQRCGTTCSTCYCYRECRLLSRFLPYSCGRVVGCFPETAQPTALECSGCSGQFRCFCGEKSLKQFVSI